MLLGRKHLDTCRNNETGCDPGPLDSGLGKKTVIALQKFLAMQPDVLELKPPKRKKKILVRKELFPLLQLGHLDRRVK